MDEAAKLKKCFQKARAMVRATSWKCPARSPLLERLKTSFKRKNVSSTPTTPSPTSSSLSQPLEDSARQFGDASCVEDVQALAAADTQEEPSEIKSSRGVFGKPTVGKPGSSLEHKNRSAGTRRLGNLGRNEPIVGQL